MIEPQNSIPAAIVEPIEHRVNDNAMLLYAAVKDLLDVISIDHLANPRILRAVRVVDFVEGVKK